MNEYLCPFDFSKFGPLLAVHASILLMNADWSGTDLRLITTRDGIWSWSTIRNIILRKTFRRSSFLRTVFIFSCRSFYFLDSSLCMVKVHEHKWNFFHFLCSMFNVLRYDMTTLNNTVNVPLNIISSVIVYFSKINVSAVQHID